MAAFGKWILGGLGWAVGGPIGALVGFSVGYAMEKGNSSGNATAEPMQRHRTGAGDFGLSLIVMSAAVMKADGKVVKSELNYVRTFFQRQFGEAKATEMVRVLRDVLKKEVPVREVCEQIRYNMQHPMRLELMHFLFGIARADGHVHSSEVQLLARMANYLGVSLKDFESIKAMFYQDTDRAYRILEIDPGASDDAVKKAYRKMAIKYHPDKVAALGEEYQEAAKKKFQQVQEAYENIRKERGMT